MATQSHPDLNTALDPEELVLALSRKGRAAQRPLAALSSEKRVQALVFAAESLRENRDAILAANAIDVEAGKASGLSGAMLDRLTLDPARVDGIASGLDAIAALPDPVGQIIDKTEPPNGLELSRIRVPIGLIGIIYESRPNVTADTAALCVRTGNAVLLRGGSEAVNSNRAIHAALLEGFGKAGVPADAVQLMPTQDRAAVGAMLTAHGLIDMIIPRGGRSLVERVQRDARVPVLAHLDGICHTYIHSAADPEMARAIALNAKMRRTGVCGAMETLLMDAGFSDPKAIVADLLDAGCEVRGDERIAALDPRVTPVSANDWDTEYLESVVSVAIVDDIEAATQHIERHSSNHTDAIITEDDAAAAHFFADVDSAIVMHNASTQFADGGEFGLGAEIGIATGRLHARGPVALEGLTTYKWIVRGSGQIRP
ncbi:glutamate-5-semialdehyde dehydrogenase [Erythrobacter sp. YT30]|uniref:glutamate-5-semialdehyde dehydrogenase n=1 Tax=Erythrobacter sp. YT30 TaxID=1735012 RepID=UPI00076C5D9F|nr:glutamate-5-semialdehyde dehydrogenase [Erythrobacter sp. YT30]KWV91379.1 gamma-glutamyl-phosphate reductase [Erythrobacter sp. YT30]